MKLPSASDFKQGCIQYEKHEQRDSMYKVASYLIEQYWGKPADMADGLGVLLLTWNNAFYRYGPFSYEELQKCIEANWAVIEVFRQKDILSYTPDDDQSIQMLFISFLKALRINSGKSKGRVSPVAVAKALHLLCPKFFPIWDDKIARAYDCQYSMNPGKQYVSFCRIAREMAAQLADHVHRNDRSILKLIEEYNYSRYTKKWV